MQCPLSFRQSSPSLRHSGAIHSLSQEPSPNLSLHFLLPGHCPHGFSDAGGKNKKKKSFLHSNCLALIFFIPIRDTNCSSGLEGCLQVCSHLYSQLLRGHLASIHKKASSCHDRWALRWSVRGTGNSPDINRKFPGEINSNRKWSGPRVEGHPPSNQEYDGVGQWGLAGVCRKNFNNRATPMPCFLPFPLLFGRVKH